MTASDDAKKALEGVRSATKYDGDPCGCAWCCDADATMWFMADTICDRCLDAKHIEALLAEIAAKDAEIARLREYKLLSEMMEAGTISDEGYVRLCRLKGDTHE